MVRDRISGYQLILITNRKSHTGLVLTSVTFNDFEGRTNSPYFALFKRIDSFAGRLRHSG